MRETLHYGARSALEKREARFRMGKYACELLLFHIRFDAG